MALLLTTHDVRLIWLGGFYNVGRPWLRNNSTEGLHEEESSSEEESKEKAEEEQKDETESEKKDSKEEEVVEVEHNQ